MIGSFLGDNQFFYGEKGRGEHKLVCGGHNVLQDGHKAIHGDHNSTQDGHNPSRGNDILQHAKKRTA